MAKPPATATNRVKLLRKRLAEAVLQGYADTAFVSHTDFNTAEGLYDTAASNGYRPGIPADSVIQDLPIKGNNAP